MSPPLQLPQSRLRRAPARWHRFSTVRTAGLVVMDGARVIGQGTHAELMELGGRCAGLYGIRARAHRVEG